MRTVRVGRAGLVVPVCAALALILAACGSGASGRATVAQALVPAAPAATPIRPATAPALATSKSAPAHAATTSAAAPATANKALAPATVGANKAATAARGSALPASIPARAGEGKTHDAGQKIYEVKNGATDVGVTKTSIKLGSVSMHGMAFGRLIVDPVVRGVAGAAAAINDRGGVLGRHIQITDCDDGPGEVSRSKSCIKKFVVQDHIFSLISSMDWGTASIHDDLRQYHLPYVGSWAYSQTEWQDPFMFPTHMSMIHEAMAGAHWVVDVIKPHTYGLICLTSPEMQLACDQVQKVVDASGAKLVKREDVSISETSMSAYVLAMRAANPDHIVHYVINPATIGKFIIEAMQQGYWPPAGISGNHLAAELIGSVFGKFPAGRYWTNTTYRLWGSEYMATMRKYAPANIGQNHHVVQVGYVGVNIFAAAAKAVGPNLTRDGLMAQLGNHVWASDASLDQRFAYSSAERGNSGWNPDYAQGREFMYSYSGSNTTANPDGSPNGWQLDPTEGVIHTGG